jgi:hypothetical protein
MIVRVLPALVTAAIVSLCARDARACDICSIYTATEMQENRSVRVSVAQQFTDYGSIHEGTTELPNPAGQRLESWIIQGVVEYQISPRFALQGTVPYIDRSYRRAQVRGLESGSEAGFGDATLIGRALVHGGLNEEGLSRVSIIGGVKFPTGDTEWLGQEIESHELIGATKAAHGPNSLISGSDLALGSGSTDFLIGTEAYATWQRFFVDAEAQYMIRTRGDFDYEYGDHLLWGGGPGIYAITNHTYTLAIQAAFSGETKADDDVAGHNNGGAFTSIYVAPAVRFTLASSLNVELMPDIPLVHNTNDRQLVSDFRFRGGVSWGL